MGTQFEYNLSLVAKRSWGGTHEGVRVQLHAGVDVVPSLDTALKGDDGSTRTLRELASEVGRNGELDLLKQGMGERNEDGLRRVFMGCAKHTHDGECDLCGAEVNPTSADWDRALREAHGRIAKERALAEFDAAHDEQHDAHVQAHERHARHEADMNLRFRGNRK